MQGRRAAVVCACVFATVLVWDRSLFAAPAQRAAPAQPVPHRPPALPFHRPLLSAQPAAQATQDKADSDLDLWVSYLATGAAAVTAAYAVSLPPSRAGPIRASETDADADASRTEDLVANAKKLFYTAYPKGGKSFVKNILAGSTISLAMIPEAVAFAFVAGVSPIVGLQTTAVLGFFAAAFGGRGGIMTGASGACAVVMTALVSTHGAVYLPLAVLIAGLTQVLAGVFGVGKFITLVPHPVMLGFVNGLAIVMTRAQCIHFFDPVTGGLLRGARGVATAALASLTMVLVKLLPRLTTAIPPSLGAVAVVTMLAQAFHLPATTLLDLAGKEAFSGGLSVLPRIGLPALSQVTSAPLAALAIALPYGVTMAAVGMVESLLTLQLVDGMVDDGTRGSTSKECIGLGIGNMASGLTGGMGGCALIGQSLINVESGGTSRLSGMAMALALGLGLVCAAPLLAMVPISALVGVMLLVCHSTFAWSSLRLFGKVPRVDILVIILVSFVTVYEDLAKAVIVGTVLSALSFSWKQSTNIRVRSSEAPQAGWSAYSVDGPLFFGSTTRFLEQFTPKTDPDDVVVDFMQSRVADHSALVAINTLADKYGELGKRVHLRHLSSDCAALLARLNGEMPPYEIIEVDPGKDPIYEVAEEAEVYANVPAPKVDESEGGEGARPLNPVPA